jgi:hypothetical protein
MASKDLTVAWELAHELQSAAPHLLALGDHRLRGRRHWS